MSNGCMFFLVVDCKYVYIHFLRLWSQSIPCHERSSGFAVAERIVLQCGQRKIKLSQNVIDYDSVSKFQYYLTLMARKRCQDGDADWMHIFS